VIVASCQPAIWSKSCALTRAKCCVMAENAEDEPAAPLPAPSARRRRQGSKHDKTGCLTCRFRRKKCVDNSWPICGTCARLNLECVRQPARSVVPEHRITSLQKTQPHEQQLQHHAALPSPSIAMPALNVAWQESLGNSPQRRHAMRYYITTLTQHATVSEQFNSFVSGR
jgi:transcriptional activator protein UGA3